MPGISVELPDEDEAYERARDREDRRAAEEAEQRRLDDLLMSTVRMARISSDETAKEAVKFVYLQGRTDALLSVKS